jgi:EAL domain-containing protein (putative c-di-GMP-specific phosphodiesterase class I)
MVDSGPMTAPAIRPCGRCQSVPPRLAAEGRLYVWFPLGHSRRKALAWLARSGPAHEPLEEGEGAVVTLRAGEVGAFAEAISGELTAEEVRATRVLFKTGEGEPGITDFPRVTTLQQFLTMSQAGWLLDMLAEGRITSHFQPIVHADDTRRVYAHEALVRGQERDGTLVPPGRMFHLAHEADILFQLDLAARQAAIRQAVANGLSTPLFINFTPTAIYDPAFCLRSTVGAVAAAGIPASNVVFEVVESDRAGDAKHLRDIIDFYRQEGFRVALDDLGAGYSSLNLIHQLRPDIVKLDMELTRNIHEDPYKALITRKILEIAQRLDILTVAEGIETPGELRWVREHGVDFVQGYLIARPAAAPALATPGLSP